MWLATEKYKEIRTAIVSGTRDKLGRILHEIAEGESGSRQAPARCPVCQKELKRGPLPYLEFFGAACPDSHGWWISPEISKKILEFLDEQLSAGMKKARQFKLLMVCAATAILFYLMLGFLGPRFSSFEQKPQVIYLTPMPAKSSGVLVPGEWQYLLNVAAALENVITSGVELEHHLRSENSVEGRKSFFEAFYAQEAGNLEKMKWTDVPDGLEEIHRHLLNAIERQTDYYALLATRPRGLRSGALLQAPAPRGNGALATAGQQAYSLIIRRYPDLEQQAQAALRDRFFLLKDPENQED